MSESVQDVMVRLGEFGAAALAVEIGRSASTAQAHIAAARSAGWVVQISRTPTLYRVDRVPTAPVAVGASPERIEALRSQFTRRSVRSGTVADGYVFPTEEEWVDHFGRNPHLMGELVRAIVVESKHADPATPRQLGRRRKDALAPADLWEYLPHRFTSLLLDGGGSDSPPGPGLDGGG